GRTALHILVQCANNYGGQAAVEEPSIDRKGPTDQLISKGAQDIAVLELQLLLDAGANAAAEDDNGQTALQLAIEQKHELMALMLYKKRVKDAAKDDDESVPVLLPEIVSLLESRGFLVTQETTAKLWTSVLRPAMIQPTWVTI